MGDDEGYYPNGTDRYFKKKPSLSANELDYSRDEKEPSGPYTSICPKCKSTDLWSDNHACGCNDCNWVYIERI